MEWFEEGNEPSRLILARKINNICENLEYDDQLSPEYIDWKWIQEPDDGFDDDDDESPDLDTGRFIKHSVDEIPTELTD